MSYNMNQRTKFIPCIGLIKSTAAASSNYGERIDMQGFDAVCFDGTFTSTGASTGTAVFSVVGSNSTATADASLTALSTASCQIAVDNSTTAATKRCCSIDVSRPRFRYLKAKVVRKTLFGINAVTARQYGAMEEVTTHTTGAVSVLATTAYATSYLTYRDETT